MKIRKTIESDIKRISEIYYYARDFMVRTGNPDQWGANNWPPIDLIRNDIKEGHSYVCLNDNNEVIGTFYYNYGKDVEPTYLEIDNGKWISDEPYAVIHRIAGDGSEKGIGAFCINWVYEKCKHIRIDTHEDNKVMQSLLKKLGFQYCGIIYVLNKSPRLAYEKLEK